MSMLINYPGLVTPADYTRAAEYADGRARRARGPRRAAWRDLAAAYRAGAARAADDMARWPKVEEEVDYYAMRAAEDPDYAARLAAARAARAAR